jgi:LacI family transcriptional regulator
VVPPPAVGLPPEVRPPDAVGRPGVREATREKVLKAIAELNYAPSSAARTLAGGDEIRIALLYSNPSSSYLSEFLVGSLDQASRSNIQLVIQKFDEASSERSAIEQIARGRIDGVVLPPPLCDSPEIIAALARDAIPAVAVATGRTPADMSAVSIDDHQAAYDMTRHLIALGHRRIGFIVGNPNQSASERRLLGYRKALADAGLSYDETLVAPGLFTYRSGLEAAEQLLGLAARPTAIFASNDDMAAATVSIAHRIGLDVPRDLTVCGFDDTALATTIWPELTTIRQPIAEMSRVALEMLIREARARKAGKPEAPRHVVLDFALIQRESDGAPA